MDYGGYWGSRGFINWQLTELMTSKIEEIKEAESRTGKPYPELTFEQAESEEKFDAWNDKYFGGLQPDVRYKNGDITQDEFCTFALRLSLRYASQMKYGLEDDTLGGICDAISVFHIANELMKMYYGIQNGSIALDVAKIQLSAMGGAARVARDPRQRAKAYIKDCWTKGRADGTLSGRYKAGFAKKMLADPKCATLDSPPVIASWCKEWEKTSVS